MTDAEIVRALAQGGSCPAAKVIELRSKGMHEIRFEFIIRALRSGARLSTVSVYWERGHEFMLAPGAEPASRKLVFGQSRPVSGQFRDLCLIGYVHDVALKAEADRELDRMVGELLARGDRTAAPG